MFSDALPNPRVKDYRFEGEEVNSEKSNIMIENVFYFPAGFNLEMVSFSRNGLLNVIHGLISTKGILKLYYARTIALIVHLHFGALRFHD